MEYSIEIQSGRALSKILTLIPGRAVIAFFFIRIRHTFTDQAYGLCIFLTYTALALFKFSSTDRTQCSHSSIFIKTNDKYFPGKIHIESYLAKKIITMCIEFAFENNPFYGARLNIHHHTKIKLHFKANFIKI